MNFPNQRDPFGYPQRRAKGCSPGLLMLVLLGFFVFWMMSKTGQDSPSPSMPDGRKESQTRTDRQSVPFPDVLPSGPSSERTDRRDGSVDGSDRRRSATAKSGNSNQRGDWSIDTNVGEGSDVELRLEPTGNSNPGESKKGDWSIDTDVRED